MNARDLLHVYRRTYYAKFKQEYPVAWQRNGAQAKRLLALYSPEDLTNFIELYINSYRDKFHESNGKPFNLFTLALPALIAMASETQVSQERVNSNETNYERLQRARREEGAATGGSSDRPEVGELPFLPQTKAIGNGDRD